MPSAGGVPHQSVQALRAPAGTWAKEVGRVNATENALGAPDGLDA